MNLNRIVPKIMKNEILALSPDYSEGGSVGRLRIRDLELV